jgi:phage terminase large subunit-like protein
MADDLEEGPDPNEIRRHQKKMLTDEQYRKRYRRIDFWKPNDKQKEFHNALEREVMLRAGNQCGKTSAAAAQVAMDALALYPEDWYEGRRFIEPPKIERPMEFLAWAGCTTAQKIRDGLQQRLLGNVRDDGGLGTGAVPLDNIVGKPAMSRGVPDAVDSVTLRRETGGSALIRFKTYEQGREAWQGEAVDEVLIDEDISRSDASIYGECLARTVTTRGRILCSLTPLLGMSPLRKRFKERLGPSMREILMTIWDAAVSKGGHIPDEDIPGIIASFAPHERETRAMGADLQGEGAVFTTPADQIRERLDPATLPPYWPWMWGVDFRHSGSATSGHPFAAVLGCWDRDNDVVHVVHAIRMLGLAPVHVAAMRQHPMWEAPVAYPHDGGRGASVIDGGTIAQTYKRLGLNMRPTHATFAGGGFNFEAGLADMEQRFATGRLRVAEHLHTWFDEYANYFRDKGLVQKIDDDLLSATRQLVMDIRYAKVPDRWNQFRRQSGGEPQMASGIDFDPFTGE